MAPKTAGRNIEARIERLEQLVEQRSALLESAVQALRSCTVMLGHVDAFLTKQHPGWDGGFKERIAKRTQDIERYRSILGQLSEASQGQIERHSDTALSELASELWALAGRLGIEANEAPRVASVYLQARNTAGCRRVLRQCVDDSDSLIEGINPQIYETLLRRCEELEAAQSNSVACLEG